MLRSTYRCGAAVCRAVRGAAWTVLAIVGCCLLIAGCTTSGQPVLGAAGIGAAGPRTVAFESIDGPPEALFRKLVAQLAQEANARQINMVSRETPAQFRIRGYVAAHVQGKKTTITWVWDVYDADSERATRFVGEVPGASSDRAWAAADDAVVTRIARDGMNRLAAFLATPGESPREELSPNVATLPGTEGALAFVPPSRQ